MGKGTRLFGVLLFVVVSVLVLSLAMDLLPVSGAVWSTPTQLFNVTPSILRLNWTGLNGSFYIGNITVTVNQSRSENVTIEVVNSTYETWVKRNYTQTYPTSPACRDGVPLAVVDGTGVYNNTYEPLNGSTSYNATSFTLVNTYLNCYPGRYYTDKFMIKNYSSSEYSNLTVYLDIPISTHNTLNNATGLASFDGVLPVNSTTGQYHSFFFNATNAIDTGNQIGMPNATGVVINLTSSSDVDIFLFDGSGRLIAKSINKTHNNESMLFNYLPSAPDMWEIRVFGNSTSSISYRGNLLFTTLQVENSTNNAVSTIDFGDVNVSENVSVNAYVVNTGNLILQNVREYIDVYAIKRFAGDIGKNFTVLVPNSSITRKVKIVLNWTGGANYSFNLYNQNGGLVANSSSKHAYANATGAMQEEYAETTSIESTTKYWTVEVLNSTNATDPYTVTTYAYVTSSDWIRTNYTTKTFNGTNHTDESSNKNGIYVNLTVPSTAVNGSYEGYVRYADNHGGVLAVTLKAAVVTPMLVVNGTMESSTYTILENYGWDLTRSLYFNITNPGGHLLMLNINDSNKTMSCESGCTGYNGSFSYPESQIFVDPNSDYMFRVNVSFNRSMPTNSFYSGWVKLVGFNASANDTSHPYQNFTINMKLNLTNYIDLRTEFKSGDYQDAVTNGTLAENITIRVNLFYKNNTQVSEGSYDVLHSISNFTAVWLVDDNVTLVSPRYAAIPANAGSLSLSNGTNPLYCTGSCPGSGWDAGSGYYINVSIPASQPGGRYKVNVNLTYPRSNSNINITYIGQSVFNNSVLFINNTGLAMTTTDSSSLSISNSSRYDYYVNVTNYGPLAASSATIKFDEGCSGYSVGGSASANVIGNGCTGVSYSDGIYTFSLGAFNSSCMFIWNITAGTSAADACTANIIGGARTWFDSRAINVSVTVTAATSVTTPPSSPGTTPSTTAPTYVANLAFTSAPTLITLKQNSTNSTDVQVKNTGNVSQAITFTIDDISSSWWSSNATSATLGVSALAGFRITFTIGDAEIKDYSAQFKVTSPNKTVTSAFTIRILPSPKSESNISGSILIYRSEIVQLGASINASKAAGVNVSTTEEGFSILMSNLQKAEAYATAGDYFSAYQLLDTIKTQIQDVKSDLETAKQQKASAEGMNKIIIAVAIAVAAAVAVLAYLLWPTKSEFKPGTSYIQREGEEKVINKRNVGGALQRLKNFFYDLFYKIKSKLVKPTHEEHYGEQK